MSTINRLLINLCSTDLPTSRDFFVSLFDFEIQFDSDWFVSLTSSAAGSEIGLIAAGHELVPEDMRLMPPQGFYLTLVVESVEAVYEKAQQMEVTVISPPADTFYGQRRMLLQGPDGMVLDVSSLIPRTE
ncbi:MAG: VOC family protein [Bacteroidota bacterium]